jgi:hypothetical protein
MSQVLFQRVATVRADPCVCPRSQFGGTGRPMCLPPFAIRWYGQTHVSAPGLLRVEEGQTRVSAPVRNSVVGADPCVCPRSQFGGRGRPLCLPPFAIRW